MSAMSLRNHHTNMMRMIQRMKMRRLHKSQKRPIKSVTKTPVVAKKAKSYTPHKTGDGRSERTSFVGLLREQADRLFRWCWRLRVVAPAELVTQGCFLSPTLMVISLIRVSIVLIFRRCFPQSMVKNAVLIWVSRFLAFFRYRWLQVWVAWIWAIHQAFKDAKSGMVVRSAFLRWTFENHPSELRDVGGYYYLLTTQTKKKCCHTIPTRRW